MTIYKKFFECYISFFKTWIVKIYRKILWFIATKNLPKKFIVEIKEYL